MPGGLYWLLLLAGGYSAVTVARLTLVQQSVLLSPCMHASVPVTRATLFRASKERISLHHVLSGSSGGGGSMGAAIQFVLMLACLL